MDSKKIRHMKYFKSQKIPKWVYIFIILNLIHLINGLIGIVFAYLGITAKDITTWGSLLDIFKQALSNPYILSLIAVSIYNAVVDPTTQGIGDSKRAISYNNPAK